MDEPQTPAQQPVESSTKPKKSKAKVVLLVLLGLLLLCGIAYGAYWYGQEQVRKENEAKVAELQEKIDAAKAEAKEAAPNLDDANDGYLVIKQWGVKLKSTESPMSYLIKNEGSREDAHLTNSAIQSFEGCKSTTEFPEKGRIAILSRYKEKPTEQVGSAEYITQIDSYYYYVVGSQAACSVNEADREAEAEQRTDLINAAKTVQAAE